MTRALLEGRVSLRGGLRDEHSLGRRRQRDVWDNTGANLVHCVAAGCEREGINAVALAK